MALAERMGLPHFDADDFFWEKTEPPFTTLVPVPVRQERLRSALAEEAGWILSGSLTGWGDFLIPAFDLVVFLALPPALRMERLRRRERQRNGDRILEGGDLHHPHRAFMTWAEGYDQGGLEMRSRATHEAWMATLACPLLRLEGDLELNEKMARVLARASSLMVQN
jgi:adenylate kinase family enzyme